MAQIAVTLELDNILPTKYIDQIKYLQPDHAGAGEDVQSVNSKTSHFSCQSRGDRQTGICFHSLHQTQTFVLE